MLPFDLQSQKWDPAGSGDAYSVQNAMGKSQLDLWNVLVREALQNSWDARVASSIDFSISDVLLSQEQTAIVSDTVFARLPPEGASKRLHDTFEEGRLRVLCISDSGTRGLGGPLRADISVEDGERSDFADFVRNFGRSQNKGLEGGTYGYGKGVLYSASQVGLCLIYSNTQTGENIETRLIGVSGGDPDYSYEGRRYTGKNWWGRLADDDVVDPLTGDEAQEIARQLGIPHPQPGTTGTTIVIISPKNSGEGFVDISPEERMDAMRDAVLTWAWPLAINYDLPDAPRVRFNFRVNDAQLGPLSPEQEPRFRNMAKAMVIAHRWVNNPQDFPSGFGIFREIRSERPKRLLGYLVGVYSEVSSDAEFQNTVALMRGPRIVVRYLSVPSPPDNIAMHAIFIASQEFEETFARAEPVTHDDWIASKVKNENRVNFVGLALRKVRAVFSELGASTAGASSESESRGTASLASSLGQLLGSFTGTDAGKEPSPTDGGGGAGGTGRRKPSARLIDPPFLLEIEGKPHVAFKYQIIGGRKGMSLQVIPTARVVVDGGSTERKTNKPLAGETPEFIGWLEGGETRLIEEKIIELPTEQDLVAIFTQPSGTAIRSILELKELRN